MTARKQHLSLARINQVIDETIWKEKIDHEKKAKRYWAFIYEPDKLQEVNSVYKTTQTNIENYSELKC